MRAPVWPLLEDKEHRDVLIEGLLVECRAHYDSHRLTAGSGRECA